MSVDLLVLLYDVLRVKVYDVGLSLNLGFSPMLEVGCVFITCFQGLGFRKNEWNDWYTRWI